MTCDYKKKYSDLSDQVPRPSHSACILYLFYGHNKDDFGLFFCADKPFNPAIQPPQKPLFFLINHRPTHCQLQS